LPILTSIMARVSEHGTVALSGSSLWLNLRLYPLSLVLYCAGIGSLAADNYRAFAAAHLTRIEATTIRVRESDVAALVPMVDAMTDVAGGNVWRQIEEYKLKRVPLSEHLYKILRPVLDDVLLLGTSYDRLFDRYEVLAALTYVDATN